MKTSKNEEEKKVKENIPYLSKGIYKNYTKGMEEKNLKRKEAGLDALHVRSYEEWVGN